MEATKDTLVSIDNSDRGETSDSSRRLHGSLRVGSDPESIKTFNLRPSIDDLPEEQAITIEINGWPAARLVCSPSAITELALGWSFARGYFDDADQVGSVTRFGDRVSIMLNRAGPRGDIWDSEDSAGFDPTLLSSLDKFDDDEAAEARSDPSETSEVRFDRLQFLSITERVFTRIRGNSNDDGMHFAAVTDGDQLSAIARDVCRQNAVDKVIGWTINQRLDCRSLILCTTGRVTADIAVKASRAGFRIVASNAVPTCEAVEIAHGHGFTLIGRILDQRRAIYAHPWRLTVQEAEL